MALRKRKDYPCDTCGIVEINEKMNIVQRDIAVIRQKLEDQDPLIKDACARSQLNANEIGKIDQKMIFVVAIVSIIVSGIIGFFFTTINK